MKQVLTLLFFLTQISFAQTDTLNQKDTKGLKQGYWIVYGKDMPEKDFPADGKIEEGSYLDDKKTGLWIQYHQDGKTPRVKGVFELGRPLGPYTKYFYTGLIAENGTYIKGKYYGEQYRYHENGCLAVKKYYNSEGKEEGIVTYYFDNCDTLLNEFGTIQLQWTKVNGITQGVVYRYYESSCLKEKTIYENGLILSTEVFSDNCIDSTGKQVIPKDPNPMPHNPPIHCCGKCTGYNKIYNKNADLSMDGEFKNGCLWNGKLYIYNDDGILMKIEIWKNGTYHSDASLDRL